MSESDLTPSPFVGAVEPITETDEEIRAPPSTTPRSRRSFPPSVYQPGDLSLLRGALHPRPDPTALIAMPQGGRSDEQLATARQLALNTRSVIAVAVLRRCRHQGLLIMEYAVGGAEMRDYSRSSKRRAARGEVRIAVRRVGRRRTSHRRRLQGADPSARACPACSPRIGSDKQVLDFVVVDKNDDVGGTWLENVSGCRVETQLQLQLFVRGTARLAAALLDPGRVARLPPPSCRRVRPLCTSDLVPRCCRRRGPRRIDVGPCVCVF